MSMFVEVILQVSDTVSDSCFCCCLRRWYMVVVHGGGSNGDRRFDGR